MNVSHPEIQIITGPEVEALLADEVFLAQWSVLAEQCPWATPFQGPAFVRCWYGVYKSRYDPVLAISRDGGGRLSGLLALARPSRGGNGTLVHAGAHQAEYQCWIALPQCGDGFILEAMQALRRTQHRFQLSFHYLPADAPLKWLDHPCARRTCRLRSTPRPLMAFGDGAEVRDSLAKRGNKSRFKRLEKLGPVRLCHIRSAGELDAMIDRVVLYYDARRLAVNGSAPFANDPLKRAFHLEMMNAPGLLHVSALMCGDEIASFHFNTISRQRVMLSLITHNPLLAAYSPGKFHVLLLARLLMEQGYAGIDLTPGGDPYKERFANEWDRVHTLDVYHAPSRKRTATVIDALRDCAKTTLSRWHVRPARVKAQVLQYARLGPINLPTALARHALGRLSAPSAQRLAVYARDLRARLQTDGPGASGNGDAGAEVIAVRRDAIDDLMKYRPAAGDASRHDFFADAMRRLECGQRLYTVADDRMLLHYAWFVPEPGKLEPGDVLAGLEWPRRSALIAACYTRPEARRRGLASASLAAGLADAIQGGAVDRAYVAVPIGNDGGRRLVEKLGFVRQRSGTGVRSGAGGVGRG